MTCSFWLLGLPQITYHSEGKAVSGAKGLGVGMTVWLGVVWPLAHSGAFRRQNSEL